MSPELCSVQLACCTRLPSNFFLTQTGFAVSIPGYHIAFIPLAHLPSPITLWGRVGQQMTPQRPREVK